MNKIRMKDAQGVWWDVYAECTDSNPVVVYARANTGQPELFPAHVVGHLPPNDEDGRLTTEERNETLQE
jgi:hypothetical protein